MSSELKPDLTQEAIEESKLARQILENRGFDRQDRLLIYELVAGGNHMALDIWLDALDEARKKLSRPGHADSSSSPE